MDTAVKKQLFESIKEGDTSRVRLLVSGCVAGKGQLDCVDEFGTSPLETAAFKGRTELCKLLLDAGADANYARDHPHSYTPLMFAALSGNVETCRLLLERGADSSRKNSVGRTASEMAAFTGQHHVVSTINNFLPMADILKAVGVTDKKYSTGLIDAIHDIAGCYNIHPVKLIMFLRARPLLLEQREQTKKVLEAIMDSEMKRQDTNEIMAMKLHMTLRVLKEICFWLRKEGDEKGRSEEEVLGKYTKHLLSIPSGATYEKNLDDLVRQAVKEFPFQQSALFHGMVRTLATTPMGSEPSAMSVVRQALLGTKMVMDETFCATCADSPATKRCSVCKAVNYCSQECQKLHWFAHKKSCAPKKHNETPSAEE